MKYNYITINDKEYPEILREINDPPQKLYFIGDISLLNSECVSIVGTRRASPYALWAAYEIGKKLANAGITIVSGMAEGIDSRGHRAALDCGSKTIAVLGTQIDVLFPKSNKGLYNEIGEKGLIISEYGPDDLTGSWSFPRRNRIISGLSRKVIIVEGAMQSGSMITAKLAIEQSRDLYALPGNINNINSIGTNRLISDGAIPIISLNELYNTLNLNTVELAKDSDQFNIDEIKVLETIKLFPGISTEEISEKLKCKLVDIINVLSILEIKGIIYKIGNLVYLR